MVGDGVIVGVFVSVGVVVLVAVGTGVGVKVAVGLGVVVGIKVDAGVGDGELETENWLEQPQMPIKHVMSNGKKTTYTRSFN